MIKPTSEEKRAWLVASRWVETRDGIWERRKNGELVAVVTEEVSVEFIAEGEGLSVEKIISEMTPQIQGVLL